MKPSPFGVLAGFVSEESFLGALSAVTKSGYSRFETFTPHAVKGIEEFMPQVRTPIPWIMLAAGALGGAAAFFMMWYACNIYPLNVGGRPLTSWPSYVPITFELTVLSAALAGVGSFLAIAGLPRLDYPVFASQRFERASQDRYFICVRADDPSYSAAALRQVFLDSGAESAEEVIP